MQVSSAFDPQSGLAQPIFHLFMVTLLIMVAILILVTELIAHIVIPYKAREGTLEPNRCRRLYFAQ